MFNNVLEDNGLTTVLRLVATVVCIPATKAAMAYLNLSMGPYESAALFNNCGAKANKDTVLDIGAR